MHAARRKSYERFSDFSNKKKEGNVDRVDVQGEGESERKIVEFEEESTYPPRVRVYLLSHPLYIRV